MKPEQDVLARILNEDDELQPMIGFSTRVMRSVREEAVAKPPIPFPWARFLPGVLLNVALLVGAAIWILIESSSTPSTAYLSLDWLADPRAGGLLWACVAMIGSGILAWITTRWVSPPLSSSF
ncbi:MAG: hypothetical protein AAGE94_09150 [Acidobacteriota bacterium]